MPACFGRLVDSAQILAATYLASTAEEKINITSLDRLEVEVHDEIPEASYKSISDGAGDE